MCNKAFNGIFIEIFLKIKWQQYNVTSVNDERRIKKRGEKNKIKERIKNEERKERGLKKDFLAFIAYVVLFTAG